MRARFFIVFSLALILSACEKDSDPSAKTVRVADADRGRRVYLAQCTTCHNSDPSKNGSTGPPIKGSSRALIEARVLRASYPPGYTPKQKSSAMRAMPYLKSAIPDLVAFLR